MRYAATLGLIILLPSIAAAQSDGIARAVGSITADDLRHRIGVLAHDSMRGRDTPSPEIEQTAAYIAAQFAGFGLRPAGDAGTFIQHYAVQRVQLDSARSVVAVAGGPTWRFPGDVAHLFGGYAPEGRSGPTVLVTGIADDPAALSAAPVAGAVVLYVAPADPGGALAPQAQRTLFGLYRREPAALILIADLPDSLWAAQAPAQFRPTLAVPWRSREGVPVLLVRDRTVRPVLARHGHDLADLRGRATGTLRLDKLPNLELRLTVRQQVLEQRTAPNVVGILEGGDAALKHEHLVFSAHMDHVGIGRPVGGDSIYNGADDDASGTAAVVELAEAYALLTPRPKRSLIFLTVSGEEKGLWGSDYFVRHPPAPIERIVANLNIDMIGRNWPDTVVVIGREHSDLGAMLERVAARQPELNITPIADPWPEENFFFRSDHYNFARQGVPALFFFSGTHEDYHRPSDHVEKINPEKQARIVKLIFYVVLEVANAAQRPQWNPESYRDIVTERR